MSEPVRLAKRVAALVPCSRREAELYIEGGWVRVDGEVVEEPQHRVTDQQVQLDPDARAVALEPVTLLLNKPAGVSPEQAQALLVPGARMPDDRSGMRTVKRHFAQLQGLLPLPDSAEGLTVFSQEARVIRKLTDEASSIEQELIAHVTGQLQADGLALLGHGLVFEGRPLPPIKVSWQNENRLRFALKGIALHRVAWMCEQVGLRVLALKRIRIGRVPMAGLPPGQWRYLQAGDRF